MKKSASCFFCFGSFLCCFGSFSCCFCSCLCGLWKLSVLLWKLFVLLSLDQQLLEAFCAALEAFRAAFAAFCKNSFGLLSTVSDWFPSIIDVLRFKLGLGSHHPLVKSSLVQVRHEHARCRQPETNAASSQVTVTTRDAKFEMNSRNILQ